MKALLGALWCAAVILFLLYFGVACAAWSFRNPTANDSTVWTEFTHVLRFHKLDKYQGNP